jgi:O-antigen ligase
MAIFGVFYSAITIVCWVLPSVYSDYIYPIIIYCYKGSVTGMSYKSGFTAHYSTNAIYLALGAIGSFCCSLKHRSIRWKVAFVLTLFALILTTKRAHLGFGAVALIVAYYVYGSKYKATVTGKVLIGASVLILVFMGAQSYLPDAFEVINRFFDAADDDTLNGRMPFYKLCIQLWLGSPFFGNGWDSYTQYFNSVYVGKYTALGDSSMDAHNVYLQILAEQGIVGLTMFLIAVVSCLVSCIFSLVKINKLDCCESVYMQRVLMTGTISVQVFFLLYCLTGNPLYDMQMYVPWLLSCAAGGQLSADLNAISGKFKSPQVADEQG